MFMAGVDIRVVLVTEYFAERFNAVFVAGGDKSAIVGKMMIGLINNIEREDIIVIKEVFQHSITFISRAWW